MLRRLPKINYADGPIVPPTHGPGANYNGMTVVRMPNVEGFLSYTFKQVRPGARDVKVVRKEPLPKLASAVARAAAPLNRQLAQAGVKPMTFHAGFMIVEYAEGGARYKELLYTVLVDARASMAAWSNDFTTLMRAPAGEADNWKPILDIISNSVQFNPQWVAGEMKGQGQRADTARRVLEDMNRIDREIVAHRDRTRKEIRDGPVPDAYRQERLQEPLHGEEWSATRATGRCAGSTRAASTSTPTTPSTTRPATPRSGARSGNSRNRFGDCYLRSVFR